MRKRWVVVLVVTPVAVVATAAAVAFGATSSGGGPVGRVRYQVSTTQVGTPSNVFQQVTALSFSSAAGPVTVRFSGAGYAEDWTGPDAAFVGKSYAALVVRVLVDGTVLAPGVVTFADNTGKISAQAARPKAASFEWVGTLPASGQHKVVVQFRNLHNWDLGGLMKWTLAVDHG